MELLTAEMKESTLVLHLNGRLDTSNAAQAESLVQTLCDANPADDVLLDVENLEYISSAGLRVVLRLKKMKPSLRIINASTEVYDIFDMTGFTEMIQVEKAFRKFSVDGCKVIGRGAKGTVYRYNADTIVKVYKNPDSLPDIQNERELARKAFVLGIPTAISYDVVRVGESYGSVFELLDATPYSDLIRDDEAHMEKYVKEYADLLRQIHDTTVKKSDMPDGKILTQKWIAGVKKHVTQEDYEKLLKLERELPDTDNMLHCDYHTNNIMLQNGETLLIDMDTLSHGHPIIELANIFVTYVGFAEYDPEDVAHFLGFPVEIGKRLWEMFLPMYLQTDDQKRIHEVDAKAKLLGYMRALRHTEKRNAHPETTDAVIASCVQHIHELLQEVDTLDF